MYPHVKAILDEICEEAKDKIKVMDPSALGSWNNAVWLTRGFHSQNCTFSLLYYEHLCERGVDDVSEGDLFPGTSKAAEGYGADCVFRKAKSEDMNIKIHFQHRESSSPKSLFKYFPDCDLKLCGNHAAKSHKDQLKKLQLKKMF